MDGAGYPAGVSGSAIPIEGRIVAVADVFDALTTERPCKHRWSNEDAVAYLREMVGRIFDGDCVEALVQRMDEVRVIQARHGRDETNPEWAGVLDIS
jgi:HD-GYP domain-containing protein (c-di-GMP phosphodiesterase class II)